MAHGTGYYWEDTNVEIEADEYVVIFYQLCNYYYPTMSDCAEPDCDKLDEFIVTVVKWDSDGTAVEDVDETIRLKSIDKKEANKIWKNLKSGKIPFEMVREYFEAYEQKQLLEELRDEFVKA